MAFNNAIFCYPQLSAKEELLATEMGIRLSAGKDY
jgi:hypothetical protein